MSAIVTWGVSFGTFFANIHLVIISSSLNQIDFSNQTLVDFEKNFYLEHPDVAKRTDQEAEAWRASKQIVVRGTDVPKPCLTFDEASMPEYVLSEVVKCGFSAPTPIQSQGWPMALKGRNMVGISATGSGVSEIDVLFVISVCDFGALYF